MKDASMLKIPTAKISGFTSSTLKDTAFEESGSAKNRNGNQAESGLSNKGSSLTASGDTQSKPSPTSESKFTEDLLQSSIVSFILFTKKNSFSFLLNLFYLPDLVLSPDYHCSCPDYYC